MSDITDGAAIAISVVALGLSIFEARSTRRHNRLSVAPRFTSDCTIIPTAERATMRLTNSGLGPATIRGFKWTLDDRSREDLGIDRFEQLTGKLSLGADVIYAFPLKGSLVRPEESLDLVSVLVGSWSAERSAAIRGAFRRLKFVVEYQSLYEEPVETFTFAGAEFYPDELRGLPNHMLPDELRD